MSRGSKIGGAIRSATATSTKAPFPRAASSLCRLVLLSLLSLALFSGCASLRPLMAPDVTLADLEVTDITPLETSARLSVRIANTNPEALFVTGGVYNVTLNGVRVGQALSNQALEIPALSEAVQEVDLRISNIALLTRLRPFMESGSLDYSLKAKIYADGAVGTRTLKVKKTGDDDDSRIVDRLPGRTGFDSDDHIGSLSLSLDVSGGKNLPNTPSPLLLTSCRPISLWRTSRRWGCARARPDRR